MYYDRDERRRERDERRAAKRSARWGGYPPPYPPGPNAPPNDPPLENLSGPELEAQLRKRVEARIEARNAFFIHLATYIGINGLFVLLWLNGGGAADGGVPWPLWIMVPWGIGLFAHAMQVFQNTGERAIRREEMIQREMEIERARLGLRNPEYEKPKRDHAQAMRLSDDGELVPADDENRDDEQPLANARQQ